MIEKSFIHYALSLSTDGSREDLIHCFKGGQPCFQIPRSQRIILQDEENSFENPSGSDVKEAYDSCPLLDKVEEDDEDIGIL